MGREYGFCLTVTIDDVMATPNIVWEMITGDVNRIPVISPHVDSIQVLQSQGTNDQRSHDNFGSQVLTSCRKCSPIKSSDDDSRRNNNKPIAMEEGLTWNEARHFRGGVMIINKQVTSIETKVIDVVTSPFTPSAESSRNNTTDKIGRRRSNVITETNYIYHEKFGSCYANDSIDNDGCLIGKVEKHELKTLRLHVRFSDSRANINQSTNNRRLFNIVRQRSRSKAVKTESITVDSIMKSSNDTVNTSLTANELDDKMSLSSSAKDISKESSTKCSSSSQACSCRLLYTTVLMLPPGAFLIACLKRRFRLPNHIHQYYYQEMKQIAIAAEQKTLMMQHQQQQNETSVPLTSSCQVKAE